MKKTDITKTKLYNAKMQWRDAMKKFFGKGWTKSKASLIRPNGARQMNVGTIK